MLDYNQSVTQTQTLTQTTGDFIIIEGQFPAFNGFPVVTWYKQTLKAVSRPSIIMKSPVLYYENFNPPGIWRPENICGFVFINRVL